MDSNMEANVLTWLATTSNKHRFDFLRKALDCCLVSENAGLMRLVEHSRKRKLTAISKDEKRIRHGASDNPRSPKVPVPSSEVPVPSSEVPVPSSEVPVPLSEVPWWSNYDNSKIVSFDCEMVSSKEKVNGKHLQQAATVGIVQYKGRKILYEATIRHQKDTFLLDKHTSRINGFENDSLVNGKPLELVQKEVHEILKDKLVVTVNGAADYVALGLCMGEYDVFDLQQHWKKWYGQLTKSGQPVMQPIGLRSLVMHYFKKDIHAGVHNATYDAEATLDMFNIYTKEKITEVNLREYFPDQYEFAHIKTIR